MEQFDPDQTDRLLRGSPHVDIETSSWSRITGLLSAAKKASRPAGASARQALREDLADAFVGAAANANPNTKTPWHGRGDSSGRHVIARVREFINRPSPYSYSVPELARFAGVSERHLRNIVTAAFASARSS